MRRGSEKTEIGLSKSTRERLRTFGRKGETWDELLNRLMDDVENRDEPKYPDCIWEMNIDGCGG